MIPFAEVIGDPISHSRSPDIHCHWLRRMGLAGEYRAVQVPGAHLRDYLADRRENSTWRGCNITIPHKQAVLPLLDRTDPGAAAIGAVNCVVRQGNALEGRNTDIDGVAEALASTAVAARKVVLIGAGGGARAAFRYLVEAGAAEIGILVRDPAKALYYRAAAPRQVQIHNFAAAAKAMTGAVLVVNASPLGMSGSPAMPAALLGSLRQLDRSATLFDMVYKPLETPFLAAGRAQDLRVADGLTMLIGQARAAFESFFGAAPPADDGALRQKLAMDSESSAAVAHFASGTD